MASEKEEIIARIARILAQEDQISDEELIRIMELLKKGRQIHGAGTRCYI